MSVINNSQYLIHPFLFFLREMCQYFFDPSCRLDWEVTLELTNTILKPADDTIISHQVIDPS